MFYIELENLCEDNKAVNDEVSNQLNDYLTLFEDQHKSIQNDMKLVEMVFTEILSESGNKKTPSGKRDEDEDGLGGSGKVFFPGLDGLIVDSSKVNTTIDYKPMSAIKTIGEFIAQVVNRIIKWGIDLVKYIVNTITNVVRKIVGLETQEYIDFSTRESEFAKKLDASKIPRITTSKVTVYNVGEARQESYDMDDEYSSLLLEQILSENESNQYIISVDVSKELNEIRSALKIFYELYDNARGSDGEHLFQTIDLELVLNMIKQVQTNLSKTMFFEYDAISKDQVKVTRKLTVANADKLRNTYDNVNRYIQNLLKAIASKKLVTLQSESGLLIYNSLTNNAIVELGKTVKERQKLASKDFTQLEKISLKFKKELENIAKFRMSLYSKNTTLVVNPLLEQYKEIYEILSVVIGTTDTRISVLSLYINHLNDIFSTLNALHTVRAINLKEKLKKMVSKI